MALALSASQILLGCGRGCVWGGAWVTRIPSSPSPSFHRRDKGDAAQRAAHAHCRARSLQGRELGKEMEEEVPPLLGAG